MTVSNSNFSNFSQVGFIAHPSDVDAAHLLRDPAAEHAQLRPRPACTSASPR